MPYPPSWRLTQNKCEKDERLCFEIKMIILCDSFFRCMEIFWGFEHKLSIYPWGKTKKAEKNLLSETCLLVGGMTLSA